jgi:glycosyltransferase involved in cell wall biosynthesis
MPIPTLRTRPREAQPTISDEEARLYENLDVVVVLPTLNEEGGLPRTLDSIPLEAMRRAGWTVRPIVMDGGSTDRTRAIAKERGVPVLNQAGRGKGSAVREALNWLAARHVRFAVVLDADCTYPGKMVPAFVELLSAGSQLVVGVRQPVTPAKENPRELVHRIGNRLLNLTASQLAGLPLLDLCSGFWAVSVASVTPLALETTGFEIEAELFAKAFRAGYTVTQIPITYHDRVGIAKLRAIRDGARILLTTLRFGRRQLQVTLTLPRQDDLRDLLSIVLVHGATDILLSVVASREADAEAIANRIRSSRPEANVIVRIVRNTSSGEPVPATVGPTPHSATPTRRLTISLPAIAPGTPTPSSAALVHLPSTGRIIAVGAQEPGRNSFDTASTSSLPDQYAGGGYRLEYSPERWRPGVDRMRAIAAHTLADGNAREIALFGANGRYGTVAVWRSGRTAPPEQTGDSDHSASSGDAVGPATA